MKRFVSTRNKQEAVGFYKAIVQGIGCDGGLLVPEFEFPKLELGTMIGLDYVSCSPFRVPIARLAAAQAAINEGK